jgi:hypothetical protein
MGDTRRTAPRPTKAPGTGPPKRIRDGNDGPNLRSLRRRASQGPFGTGTRHLQGPQAGKLSGVVQLRLRNDLLRLCLTHLGSAVYESDSLQGAFSEERLQDGAYPQPLLTPERRQVASIPSDRPQHLGLQNKDTLQRIQTE